MDLAAPPAVPSRPPLQPRRIPRQVPFIPGSKIPPLLPPPRSVTIPSGLGARHSRPTDAAAWWRWGRRPILGGRDAGAGGTWLACSREGKVAFLTNIREQPGSGTRSRGELPCRFLESEKSPLEFAEELIKEAGEYGGFNLVVADLCSKSMVYICNRPHGEHSVQLLPAGLFVMTNGKLGVPVPKLECLYHNMEELLQKYGDGELNIMEMVNKLMGDKVKAGIRTPLTYGWDPDMEFNLSSVFIDAIEFTSGLYGTRSQTALSVKSDGETNMYERYLEGNTWKEHNFDFQIKGLQD